MLGCWNTSAFKELVLICSRLKNIPILKEDNLLISWVVKIVMRKSNSTVAKCRLVGIKTLRAALGFILFLPWHGWIQQGKRTTNQKQEIEMTLKYVPRTYVIHARLSTPVMKAFVPLLIFLAGFPTSFQSVFILFWHCSPHYAIETPLWPGLTRPYYIENLTLPTPSTTLRPFPLQYVLYLRQSNMTSHDINLIIKQKHIIIYAVEVKI